MSVSAISFPGADNGSGTAGANSLGHKLYRKEHKQTNLTRVITASINPRLETRCDLPPDVCLFRCFLLFENNVNG